MDFAQCIHHVWVVPMTCSPTYIFNALNWSHCRLPIQTSARNRVKRVGNGQYASAKWNYIGPQACWITRPIPALVVVAQPRSNFSQGRMLRNHVGSDVGVPSHDFPFLLAQGSGLIQNVVPYTDFPQVMKRPGCSNALYLSVTKFELLTQPTC